MKNQRYITAGVTIAAAAMTAHIMQSGGQSNPQTAAISTAASAAPVLPNAARPAPAQPINEVTVLVPGAEPAEEQPKPEVTVDVLSTEPEQDAPAVATAAVAPTIPTDVVPVLPVSVVPDLPVAVADPAPAPIQASLPAPTTATPTMDVVAPEPTAAVPVAPALPSDVALPSPLPVSQADLPGRVATLEDTLDTPLADEPARNAFGLTCGPTLSARASDEALVMLTLTAPCRGDERITVRHGALEFTGKVDPLGSYQVRLPAMAANATFTVTFDDGEAFSAADEVPNVTEFERVALVSNAGSGLQIHALEFGAQYGEPGHVWADAPGDPLLAPLDGSGFMLQLGDDSVADPILAQVYTFPRDGASEAGVVRLSVEAEVTLANCASEVSGFTIEPGLDGAPTPVAMTVEMPDCEAVGEYLVLKNLLRDLRIASR